MSETVELIIAIAYLIAGYISVEYLKRRIVIEKSAEDYVFAILTWWIMWIIYFVYKIKKYGRRNKKDTIR